MDTSTIYQFKVTLRGTKPPIWRRIQVTAGYSFYQMHHAIQQAMGWMGHHMHRFTIVNPQTGATDQIGILETDNIAFDGPVDRMWVSVLGKTSNIQEQTAQIAKYFTSPGDKGIYEYDFGDGWKHLMKLEKIFPRIARDVYPKCTDGRRACPPDDCSGVTGYEELLKIMADPTHEEHEERKEWLNFMMKKLARAGRGSGEAFSPEKFNPSSVKFKKF